LTEACRQREVIRELGRELGGVRFAPGSADPAGQDDRRVSVAPSA
jgi:hypothetical protein